MIAYRHWKGNLRPPTPAAGGGAAFAFKGAIGNISSNNIVSGSIDIGTASADRLVIVEVMCQTAGLSVTSVVVNGVTLTQDVVQNSVCTCGIFSGLVTSGNGPQTVTVTFSGGAFVTKEFYLYTATGLTSNVVKTTGSGTGDTTITTAPGDFLFAVAGGVFSTSDWHLSTATLNPRYASGPPENGLGGDLTVSFNGTFHVFSNFAGGGGTVSATYA